MITAFSNKYLLSIFLILSGLSLSAQENLTGERLRLFNEQFFAAQNAKLREEYEKAFVLFEALYQKDPDNALVCYELAQLHAQEEQEQDAIFFAERAHSLEPDNDWYFRLQLAIYEQFGRSQERISSLEKSLDKKPDQEALRFQLAEAYYRAGKPSLAIEQLDILEKKVGLQEEISNQKKSLYLEIGNFDGAKTELEKLIKQYPRSLDYRGALGQLYQANGFPEKALETYLEMLEIDSLDPRPHLDLANYYQQSNQFGQSIYHLKKAMMSTQLDMERKIAVLLGLFEASNSDSILKRETFKLLDEIVKQEPADARVYALYGDYLSREGKDLEAVKYYKKALSYGEKFQIWEQILLIEIQNRDFAALREDASEAILAFPNQPLPFLLAGIAFKESADYEGSRDLLEEGINLVFNNSRLQTEFNLQLAEVNYRMENYSESDYHFDQVLDINPNHAGALNNYAYYLSQREERLPEALEMSEKANTISPNNPVYLDTKAWIHFKLGELELAKTHIEQAIQTSTQLSAEILEHYGDILWELGDKAPALEQYKRALEIEDSPRLRDKIKRQP